MLEYVFMQRGLLVGSLLGIAVPLVGVTIVLKRLSMIGDALSHTSLAGVAGGLVAGASPVAGAIVACVGGGSNAIGMFTAFLDDADVHLVGVEPAGEGVDHPGRHAATLTRGKPGEIHGMSCYVLENADGSPATVHSIASGLDYPGVGPEHSYLKDVGRVEYTTASDKETLDAFLTLSQVEGIIPALESAHAVAWAIREAPKRSPDEHILVNLSGRGDKDADYVASKLGL